MNTFQISVSELALVEVHARVQSINSEEIKILTGLGPRTLYNPSHITLSHSKDHSLLVFNASFLPNPNSVRTRFTIRRAFFGVSVEHKKGDM